MDYGALIQMAIAYAGQQQAQKMSEEQLALLGHQLAQLQGIKLPDLQQMKAEQLGPSAVGQMAPDEALRGKQLQALGEIQNVINRGGLDLSDRASLEDAMNSAINQQQRARAGVAADAAARGQLNSGNRLLMDMNAAQQGANTARQNGLDVAAMAQKRRLQAIQDSANVAGNLRNEDWAEKEAAAQAKDLRDQRNATARESAQKYNLGLQQQQFQNQISKVSGQQPATNALSAGISNAASDARANAAGLGAVANQATKGAPSGGSGGGYQYSVDSNDPNSVYANGTNYGGSDPSEWENPYA